MKRTMDCQDLNEQEMLERHRKTVRVNKRKHEERVEGIKQNKEAKRQEKQKAAGGASPTRAIINGFCGAAGSVAKTSCSHTRVQSARLA